MKCVLYASTIRDGDGVNPSEKIDAYQMLAGNEKQLAAALTKGLNTGSEHPLSLIVVQAGEMLDRHLPLLGRNKFPIPLNAIPIIVVQYDSHKGAAIDFWRQQGLNVVAIVPSHAGRQVVPQLVDHILSMPPPFVNYENLSRLTGMFIVSADFANHLEHERKDAALNTSLEKEILYLQQIAADLATNRANPGRGRKFSKTEPGTLKGRPLRRMRTHRLLSAPAPSSDG